MLQTEIIRYFALLLFAITALPWPSPPRCEDHFVDRTQVESVQAKAIARRVAIEDDSPEPPPMSPHPPQAGISRDPAVRTAQTLKTLHSNHRAAWAGHIKFEHAGNAPPERRES